MSNSITSELVTMQNMTNQKQAQEKAISGVKNDLGQDAFLQLMMEQLKYQDPLEPMDNSQFLTQQAQFTQVSSLQNLESSMNSFTKYFQAASMIGKDVIIQNPNNAEEYLYGNVEAVNMSAKDASVVIDGKGYPLSSIVQVQANPITASAEEN